MKALLLLLVMALAVGFGRRPGCSHNLEVYPPDSISSNASDDLSQMKEGLE